MNLFAVRSIIGMLINKTFLGVEQENIENYYQLVAIQFIGTLLPMTYIYQMMPTNQEIDAVHRSHSQTKHHDSKQKVNIEYVKYNRKY